MRSTANGTPSAEASLGPHQHLKVGFEPVPDAGALQN
jgi:hypothetical protein